MNLYRRVDTEAQRLEHIPFHIEQLLLCELIMASFLKKYPHSDSLDIFKL